jgi:hypothetical protein
MYDTITEKSPRRNAGAFSSGAKSWLFGCGMPHIRLFNCLFIITPVFSNGHTQKKKAHVSMRLFLVNRCSGECTPRQKPGVAPDFLIVPPISEMVTLAEKKFHVRFFSFPESATMTAKGERITPPKGGTIENALLYLP